MRRGPLVIVASVCVVAVAVAWGALWLEVHRSPQGHAGESRRVDVATGEPLGVVSRRLHEVGVIRSPRALRLYAKLRRVDRRIQTGTYDFVIGENAARVLDRLVAGDILTVAVTIPEGFMTWEIAGAFQSAGVDSVELLQAFGEKAALERRRVDAPTLEGYLFPDTYVVPWGAPARDVVGMMTARLDEVFDDSLFARAVELGMTPHQVLTLASIVEAETRVREERPLVSAVYHNRLRRGMRLEADPTVAYAMGGYKGRLLYADLEIDSPYNTYRRAGLPPGPICSPGEASIRAALYPDSTARVLYFVARGDGSHIFSHTLREHQAAVREFRRNRGR